MMSVIIPVVVKGELPNTKKQADKKVFDYKANIESTKQGDEDHSVNRIKNYIPPTPASEPNSKRTTMEGNNPSRNTISLPPSPLQHVSNIQPFISPDSTIRTLPKDNNPTTCPSGRKRGTCPVTGVTNQDNSSDTGISAALETHLQITAKEAVDTLTLEQESKSKRNSNNNNNNNSGNKYAKLLCAIQAVAKMEQEIQVTDRLIGSTTYSSCFPATNAITYLLHSKICINIEEAVGLMNMLLDIQVIRPVNITTSDNKPTFQNDSSFYQFVHNNDNHINNNNNIQQNNNNPEISLPNTIA